MSTSTLFEILKYTIPSIIALAGAYAIVNKFLVSEIQRKQMAIFNESKDMTLRLRLQAYERLIMLVERIGPKQLLPRLYQPHLTAKELAYVITQNITAEFEHNLSQQVYVSRQVWQTVRNTVEQETAMVQSVLAQLPAQADARALQTKIVDYLMSMDGQMPSEIAVSIITEEARKVLSFAAE